MMTPSPYTIALIGGIASGKSSVLNFFQKLGIKTISADIIAKDILKKNEPAYHVILNQWGPDLLLENQELNRSKLREKIINDPIFKKWLEELTHPLIRKKIIESIQLCKSPYCVVEIPLLQSRRDYPIDRILYIQTPEDQQRARLLNRGLQAHEIEGLLKLQIPRSLQLKLADDIIENKDDLNHLEKMVQKLHLQYIKNQ